MNLLPRDVAARLGHETVRILGEGGYRTPGGDWVDLGLALETARRGTVEYSPEDSVCTPGPAAEPCRLSVENATVLAVGRRLATAGPVAALNFASALSPGGGFLHGARAQEESIARSSGLFHCLKDRAMYARHLPSGDPFYSDSVIVSPSVPVFRNDDGDLLEEPWLLSVITCAAVNGVDVAGRVPHRTPEIPGTMRRRTTRVLTVAAAHGFRRLILGAWGCGAFGLDAEMMAEVFRDALELPFRGVFDEVVFAITDWSDDSRFIGPFQRRFEAAPL